MKLVWKYIEICEFISVNNLYASGRYGAFLIVNIIRLKSLANGSYVAGLVERRESLDLPCTAIMVRCKDFGTLKIFPVISP